MTVSAFFNLTELILYSVSTDLFVQNSVKFYLVCSDWNFTVIFFSPTHLKCEPIP